MTATGAEEGSPRPPSLEPAPPAEQLSRSTGRFGVMIPIALVVLGAARYVQAPMNVYDGGLLMTLFTFTSPDRLPYRDLWTLYGPGPPMLGSIVTQVFGSGLLPVRLLLVCVHAVMAAGVFALARRYVAWGWAAVLAGSVASFAFLYNHFHFAESLAFLLWGLWFLLRAGDDPVRASRRATIGAVLLGLSFWGRYELVIVAVALVVGMWWYLRPVLGPEVRRRILIAGLVPPALFVGYVLTVVGWERASLNLIEYPLRLYPRSYCRGGFEVWGPAWRALIVPLTGRWWTGNELTLAVGTYVVPVLGLLVLVQVVRRRWRRSYQGFVALAVGFLTIALWIEHRPRAGLEPHPTWPLALVCAAILLGSLRRRAVRRGVGIAVAAVLGITFASSWLPDALRGWSGWPDYHPRYGYARGEATGLYDVRIWDEVTRTAQAFTGPDDPVFVALTPQNTGHFANAPLFYWLVDRPPGSRFIEFNPCLTDTAEVQRTIVGELDDTNVVIATAYFPQSPPPLGPPPTELDGYLAENFEAIYEGDLLMPGDIVVLVRRGTPMMSDATA